MDSSRKLMLEAFRQLAKEGRAEEFDRLAYEIASGVSTAIFFQDFEGMGCFLQLERGVHEPVLRFGTRRARQGFWSRIRDSFTVLFRKDIVYEIHLNEENVVKLKNVLRHLEMLDERNQETTVTPDN